MVGTVSGLRRYPVKSLLGEEVADAEVTGRGLAGDRLLALVHRESGKVAGAKNPRLWRDLLKLRAEIIDSAVRIVLPDGKILWSTDADIDRALSRHLDRPVTLADAPPADAVLDRSHPEEMLRTGRDAEGFDLLRFGSQAPKGTFFDFAPLHLITRGTLQRISELSTRGAVEMLRYRPNIVIHTEAAGFVENEWPGRELRIGDDTVLKVVGATPRCAVPTLEHGDLPGDLEALRVPAQHNRIVPLEGKSPGACAGVYAQVVRTGRVRQGDAVRLI
jgi:uncharacterized protein YcbX